MRQLKFTGVAAALLGFALLVHPYGDATTANQGVWIGVDIEATTGPFQYSAILEWRGDPGVMACDHFDHCWPVWGMPLLSNRTGEGIINTWNGVPIEPSP